MNIYKNLSLGIVVMLLSACETEQECKEADLVIFNSEIYTANEKQVKVEALAVLDGKFIFVGSNKDSLAYQCGATEILNLENSFVYPGFIDCLLYTSDAADEEDSVDLGGRRIIKKKKRKK